MTICHRRLPGRSLNENNYVWTNNITLCIYDISSGILYESNEIILLETMIIYILDESSEDKMKTIYNSIVCNTVKIQRFERIHQHMYAAIINRLGSKNVRFLFDCRKPRVEISINMRKLRFV